MTGLLFDHPVAVELQDEARFVEVTRGRNGISFVPPQDMLPGEQLWLLAGFQVGEIHQSVTFVLVAHPGKVTHQLDIYRDKRTWQSLHDELNQEWLTNKHLKEENELLKVELVQVKARLELSGGLRGAYINRAIDQAGIKTQLLAAPDRGKLGTLGYSRAVSYVGLDTVAVEVWVENTTRELWAMKKATLVNDQGESLAAIRIWQPDVLLTQEAFQVLVEFDKESILSGRITLNLEESGPRTISVPDIVFP